MRLNGNANFIGQENFFAFDATFYIFAPSNGCARKILTGNSKKENCTYLVDRKAMKTFNNMNKEMQAPAGAGMGYAPDYGKHGDRGSCLMR